MAVSADNLVYDEITKADLTYIMHAGLKWYSFACYFLSSTVLVFFPTVWNGDTFSSCVSHLLEVCDRTIAWYRCRNVKAVMAWNWKLSFSEMIFSMRPRSDTVNVHWLMRISSCVDDTSHLSSTTLAAIWRQPMLIQAKCLGWTFKADKEVAF